MVSSSLTVMMLVGAAFSLVPNAEGAEMNVTSMLHITDLTAWSRQCLGAFQAVGAFSAPFGENGNVDISNYILRDMPNGLCADFLTCAFDNCKCDATIYDALKDFDAQSGEDVESMVTAAGATFNLPDYVSFPKSVEELVAIVKYADERDYPISVKTSGHSYVGSSTQKGSININLRDFPAYTQVPFMKTIVEGTYSTAGSTLSYTAGPLPSAVWCDMLSPELMTPACKLAKARGMNATLRIGGGEAWDNAYRAVEDINYYFDKYFNGAVSIVGGGAGTVGAVGGWMQGNGLSTGFERLWGFGMDQILEIEMVLVDGTHIKFGPTEWEDSEGFFYPKTTKVEGKCNRNVTKDETKWVWEECAREIPFEDLWFAVRGGGGGSYGILTAATEQLVPRHPIQRLNLNNDLVAELADIKNDMNSTLSSAATTLQHALYDFWIDVLYNPTAVGLDEETSNGCGSPKFDLKFGHGDPVSYTMICHGGADKVIAAYQRTMGAMNFPEALSKDHEEAWMNLYTVQEASSYLALIMATNAAGPYSEFPLVNFSGISPYSQNVFPIGRAADIPNGMVWSENTNCTSSWIPIDFLLQKNDDVYALLDEATGPHLTGGRAGKSQDQMTAVNPIQRTAAMQFQICHEEPRKRFLPLLQKFYPSPTSTNPMVGGAEYNHVSAGSFGPLRTNISIPCPLSYTHEERVEKCYSYQEFVWGTEGLAKLEQIKRLVNPKNLLNCQKCVGYKA